MIKNIGSCQEIFRRLTIGKNHHQTLPEKMCSLSGEKGVLMISLLQGKNNWGWCGVELIGKFTNKNLRHSCSPMPWRKLGNRDFYCRENNQILWKN